MEGRHGSPDIAQGLFCAASGPAADERAGGGGAVIRRDPRIEIEEVWPALLPCPECREKEWMARLRAAVRQTRTEGWLATGGGCEMATRQKAEREQRRCDKKLAKEKKKQPVPRKPRTLNIS